MIEKPQIQYVGQFYVHGSEARQLEIKKEKKKVSKTRLPEIRTRKVQLVYLDPVAMVAMAVAVVMLAVMLLGIVQIYNDWDDYRAASEYVAGLRAENARLSKEYRESYDLEDIRSQATGLGLVPVDQAEAVALHVTMPEPQPVTTWVDDVVWFWNGLWA